MTHGAPVNVVTGSLFLLAATLLSAPSIAALTLCSSDAVDHIVDRSAAIAHSRWLYNTVRDLGRGDGVVIPLPGIYSAELVTILDFINATKVYEVERAAQWARDKHLATMDIAEQCRLLGAAEYLDMPSFTIALATAMHPSTDDIARMRVMLSKKTFRFVMGIIRLGQMARTDDQHAIVRRIHILLIVGGDVALVNDAIWEDFDNVLYCAAEHGEEHVVDLLLTIPGIDARAPDFSMQWTTLD
ncbi:unnamed protein product (mitochondrion) [Plasmodiophora brassicae]|uniref:SKP1 component POZ domain-containing protein n=1 Tax=Plasmodiophora brassicae TaxID=37360 RepID=A0A0G4J5U6_PLABS|nr:hypothetical protein PBRA_009168 [Plasmodiophora brassicae]SPR01557.1 unnamed protein product [Plasmodiophora brassicae]